LWEISRLAEKLLASVEGLCSVDLYIAMKITNRRRILKLGTESQPMLQKDILQSAAKDRFS
jgi:hypothetical protein